MTVPYITTIDISDDSLEQFHKWTGYNTLKDGSAKKSQMRDFDIDLGMAVLGFGILCNWTVKSRKLDFKGKTNLLYELRGSGEPQPIQMYRQNCSEDMAFFLHGRLIRTLDFLRFCSKYSAVPHVHVICLQNHYILSAIWRIYQNKIWMIPVDQVESLSFSSYMR
jgi:hypothetical protein